MFVICFKLMLLSSFFTLVSIVVCEMVSPTHNPKLYERAKTAVKLSGITAVVAVSAVIITLPFRGF